MADVPQVGITNGVPTSGTGTVQTISTITDRMPAALGSGGGLKVDGSGTALPVSGTVTANLAAGNNNVGDVDVASVPTDPFGANGDAASATGSISAKLRGIATALGITAFDLGAGTGGSRTLRVAIDTSQTEGTEYETVAASQTAQVLGPTGAAGDFISGLLIVPATTSPGQVLLLDNATSITIFVGGATSVSNLIPFYVPLGMISVSGAWKVTTGASVSVIGIGNFT